MKKWTALILALIVLLSAVACASGDNPADTGTGTASGTSGETVGKLDANGFVEDDLPDDLDFNGATVRVLYPSEVLTEFFCEEPGEDIVSQAVYATNLAVEERLHVDYQVDHRNGYVTWNDRVAYQNHITQTFASGDDIWDIVGELVGHMATVIFNGCVIDLNSVPYIELDKPWWMQTLRSDATVNGRLYLVAGDASLSLLKNTTSLLYNKALAEDLQLGDIQKLALDGGWTKDVMKQYSLKAYSALDPANPDLSTDTFGFGVYNDNHIEAFKSAFDFPMMTAKGGEYEFTYDCERAVEAVSWLCDFFHANKGNHFGNGDYKQVGEAFMADRMLFCTATWDLTVDVFNEFNGGYSILPLPKWSEDEEYSTQPRGVYITYGIMRTSNNVEVSGAFLEAVASKSYRSLTPVYFEQALKVKYSDAEKKTMDLFNLIHDSVKIDFGYTFSLFFGLESSLKNAVRLNLPYWSSNMASGKKTFMENYDRFFETVAGLEDE